MGFGKCHLFFGCGVMKFFILSLFLLLLFDSPQGSSLPHKRCIRALNTTLQTNFNGTYERINPCTNAEIETSSYVASHEFHHHTKEDTWGDYSQKCSAIISGFLQAIGNLIRFNNKQNGIFNFHINTSISQKQDGYCDSNKQKSCASLPTIVIEATGNEISPGSTTKNPPLKTERPWEVNAREREYSFGGQPSTTPALYPSTLASQEPSIFDSDDHPNSPLCRTTAISFEKTTPVYPSQPMEQNSEREQLLQNGEVLSTPVDVLPPAIQTSKRGPPFLAQFPTAGTVRPEESSPAVFDEIPPNTPTTCEPEQQPNFYGTSPISIFNPDIPNGNTLRLEDESTTSFPTAYESSPPNTLENTFTAVTYPEKPQPLKTISSSTLHEETEYVETLRTTPSQPFDYSTPDFRQQPVNNEQSLIQNQYQPSLIGGPQAQTVDSRQQFYDHLGGRVPESQQSANSFTPGEEMATGLPPNQFFQGPTEVEKALGHPERIPLNLVRTGVLPVQSVTGLDNVNSPNTFRSQPAQTPLSTPVPVEFPQSDVNSFSLPPRSPGLISADSQNQASSTTARSEYDELSDQFYITKPPQTDEDLLNNARTTPEFPMSYTGPSLQPSSTMLPTDYDTNDYSTPFPEESPIPDEQTLDATLGPQSGFTDILHPTHIETQPNEPIWYDNRPTTLPPFPKEKTYNTPNYNDFSTLTTQRQDFLTPESQVKPPPHNIEQNLAKFNDRILNVPDESPQASMGAEPFSPTVSDFAFTPKLQFPYPGSAFNYNNEPVSRTFQAITTPKIQPPQSLTTSGFTTPEPEFSRVTPEQTRENVENEQYSSTTAISPIPSQFQTTARPDLRHPVEYTNEKGLEGLNDFPFNNQQMPNILDQPESQVTSIAPFDHFPPTFSPEQEPVGGYRIPRPTASFQPSERPEFQPSVDYPSEGTTQMPDSTIYNQQTPSTFIQPEQQLTTSTPFGEIPKRFSPKPQYAAGSEYEDETTPTTELSLRLSDSNMDHQRTPNAIVQPEQQLSNNAPSNEFLTTLSPEQQLLGNYEFPKPPISTPMYEDETTPEPASQPSLDFANQYAYVRKTGTSPSIAINQQTPSSFVNPELQFPRNTPPSQFPPQVTQSDNTFVEGSSPTEYPTSPNYDRAPERFQPTLASSDTDYQPERITELHGPYYNPNLDFTTPKLFIHSIPTATYKNQSELQPNLITSVQTWPDKFTTKLTPDFVAADQDYTTFSPFELGTSAGYQGEKTFSGLPPFVPSTTYPPQQSFVPDDESQMTSPGQPTVIPQAPFSSEQNSDETSVQPSFSEDSRKSTQYPDIYSSTASNEYQTTQPTKFLDDSNERAFDIPGPELIDQPSGSFTMPESYPTYGAEPAYASTSPNTFVPETSLSGNSPNYSQSEQRPNTIGPNAVGDFSRENQRDFSSRPFLQDRNEKFQDGQPLNLQSRNPFDSARNGYETAYPEQTSYERFPTTTPITPPYQERSTAPNRMLTEPQTPTQWQPEDSFASSDQPLGYGMMLPASNRRIVENSPTTSPTPFVDLDNGQSKQEPNQPAEYPIEGLTRGPNPTTFEPAVYKASPPQTITPVYDERPYPTRAESAESPAVLPEETQPSFIPGTSFAPRSEPQDQENIPTEQLYNYDQTEQYPDATTPVQQSSIKYPMNYQPGSYVQPRITYQPPATEDQMSEQPPYLRTKTTAFPSRSQSNGYNEDLTTMEYGSTDGRIPSTTAFPSEPQQNNYSEGLVPMEYEPNKRRTSPAPAFPSGPQPNEYNKYITPNEYQSTALPAAVAEGSNYPNEISNLNTSPENSVTFPPVGPQSLAPQFTPRESLTGSFVTGQPADSPKTQTDAYVSYSQTQSASELEPQSLISTIGNDQSFPSKFRPSYFPEQQTEITSPYLNDRSGGFRPAFAVTEQIPLKTTLSMIPENQTIKPSDFRSLDSTEPESASPFSGTSDVSAENFATVPTFPPRFQYGPNQQQPTFDRPLPLPPSTDYNQFPSTVSSQFTPTYGEEPTDATQYPSQPPKPRIFSQSSPDYYTDVPGFDRNSENEQSLSTFGARQNTEPQPKDVFTDLANYTPETNAPSGEYQGRAFTPKANIPLRYSKEAPFAAFESSPAPVPQDTPIPQQNLKSFTQDVPMDSTPFAPEPQPQNSFDYTTEIPDYRTTDGQTIDSSSPFQPEPFATNRQFSATTPQQTYTNAPDNINTRPDFSLPQAQPERQQYDREFNPNVNLPTSTLGYPQTNNQPDLAFVGQEPIADGVTSPYPPNPTTAFDQTFSTPATPMIDSSNEPTSSFEESSETLQAQDSSDIPSRFHPSPLLPEFGSTPAMNPQQFSPFSEIPDRGTRYQTNSESQSTTFSEMQKLGPIDSPLQYTTPRQQTDYPPPFASRPQDQVPNNIPSNNQEKIQPTNQLIQGDLPSSPTFYEQYSSTVPPEYLNGEPVANSEYPTPEPVLNYTPQISNPKWETIQIEQPQPNMDGKPIMSYDRPSILFTDRPDTVPEPQSIGYTMQDGEYNKAEPEISPNPQGYPGPTPEPYSGSNLSGGLQSDSFVGFPTSFQQTTPSGFSTQTQTPPFETYSNGNSGPSGPVTSPQPLPFSSTNPATNFPTRKQTKTVEEIVITEFPVTDSTAETQLPYKNKLLNTDNDLLDASPQDATTPQPYDFTESSSYPDPLTGYNVRQRPDRQLAFGGTTTPQYSENKNDWKAESPTERPELDRQPFALGNPVSPNYADYDQGFSIRPPTLTEYDETPPGLTPRVTAPTDRPQFVTEGPNDQQLGITAQRETDSPLGFGFEERSPFNSELPTYLPPQQEHSNPLLQALETQMPLSLQNHLQHTAASSFPEQVSLNPRGTSPIPFSFESQNQNDVPTVPPYYPGGDLKRNFGTSQPVVNTARDVTNMPLPDSQALVPDLPSTPSNKPDRPTTGRFDYMSSSLRNPYMRSIG